MTGWGRLMGVMAPAAMVPAAKPKKVAMVPRLVKRVPAAPSKMLWTRMHRVAS